MLRDHENVLASLYDFAAGDRELSAGHVKELHAEMLRHQETVVGVDQFGNRTQIPMNHGVFKMRPNNPHTPEGKLHEYCPWEQTASEMDRLIAMHKTHSAHPPIARAAWLHHRFVQIHPFEDGNGRIARCLATVVLLRGGLFPMVVMNEEREKYLDALQAADAGDLSPLICRIAEWQRRYFLKALGAPAPVPAPVPRPAIHPRAGDAGQRPRWTGDAPPVVITVVIPEFSFRRRTPAPTCRNENVRKCLAPKARGSGAIAFISDI